MKKLLHNDEKCVTIKALYVNLLLGGIRIMATFYASKQEKYLLEKKNIPRWYVNWPVSA